MKLLVVSVALVVAVDARDAASCSISPEPRANVFGPTDRAERGHRPWIRLWNVREADKVTLALAPPCGPRKVCSADPTPLASDREGAFLRPRAPLPSGAQVWVVAGGKTLETFTVTSAPAASLPAWSGMSKPTLSSGREALCAPSGPVITTRVLPTKADLSDAVLLVYTKQPDAARPLAGLGAIYALAVGELELRNGLGNRWLAQKPARVWTAIADGEGNVGPIVEHVFGARAQVIGAPDEPAGTRPWIRVWGAKAVALHTVDAACDPSAVCAPTMTVAFERGGDFVRPRNPLPQGARLQVVSGKSVLADVTVRTGPARALPALAFSLAPPAPTGPGACPTPAMIAPDLAQLETAGTVVLVYASRPDPAAPLAKVAAILRIDGRWLDFGAPGQCLFKKLPPKLWTILATDDGALGAPVEHDLAPKKLTW